MKSTRGPFSVSFDKLINLFVPGNESAFILDPKLGAGSLEVYDLAKGLQARIWTWCLNEEIEIYSSVETEVENDEYYTLAFFADTKGLNLANNDDRWKENRLWDTLFISSRCNYKLRISPGIKGEGLSISFSKRWFNDNIVEGNESLKNLKEKFELSDSFLLVESMSESEKKVLTELLNTSWKKSMGTFYIKTYVLKIIIDFFNKIKERETFSVDKVCLDSLVTEVEKYLSDQVKEPLPNLKEVADKFSISESTLKRHFKKKYGVNMSSYFMSKKMEYAKRLMQEENTTYTETANMLGYQNVNHFVAMFKKHNRST